MRPFLVFGFDAPMGSFGNVGSQKVRETAQWPQKSAILGICGAALGIKRCDLSAQAELLELRLATLSKTGTGWIDYQTASGIAGTRVLDPWALRNARAGERQTDPKLRRHYLSDINVRAALWSDAEHTDLLDRLAAALRRPRYPLYCGRRSCPLTGFLPPRLTEADNAEAAIRSVIDMPDLTGWVLHSDTSPAPDGQASVISAWDQPRAHTARAFEERRVFEKSFTPAWDNLSFEDILK